jgi:hypothetical protein
VKRKYKNLNTELQQMWDMKCFVTVVIIGAMGIVAEGLKKYLETIPGKYSCTRDITYNKESATI